MSNRIPRPPIPAPDPATPFEPPDFNPATGGHSHEISQETARKALHTMESLHYLTSGGQLDALATVIMMARTMTVANPDLCAAVHSSIALLAGLRRLTESEE